MPLIILIAALSENDVIGNNSKLPWHIPEDLAHFKEITTGYPIVMGRKTWDSLETPLPNRRNIVLSRSDISAAGISVCHDIDQLLRFIQNESKVFIIGGETLYQQMLPYADQMILTRINKVYEGDTFFPKWNALQWQKTSEEEGYSTDFPHHFTYQTFNRIRS